MRLDVRCSLLSFERAELNSTYDASAWSVFENLRLPFFRASRAVELTSTIMAILMKVYAEKLMDFPLIGSLMLMTSSVMKSRERMTMETVTIVIIVVTTANELPSLL